MSPNDHTPGETGALPQWWEHWLAPIVGENEDPARIIGRTRFDTDAAAEPNYTPGTAIRIRRSLPGPRVLAAIAAATAAALAGVVALALMPTGSGTHPHSPRPAAAPASTPDPLLGGGPDCTATRTAGLVRGNGTGSIMSGPDVILAFQRAYYGLRDGSQARAVVAPDASVPPADVIQAGISTIPTGTTYCVTITPLTQDRWTVTVTESHPDTTTRSFAEVVTTAQINGRALITSITGA